MTIKITRNFEENLNVINAFWVQNGYPKAYDQLLDEIENTVLVNLERFPTLGRPFLDRRPDSAEAVAKREQLHEQLARINKSHDVREYVMADYLLLYAIIGKDIYLLSIRHHKQLSFDFMSVWT